MRIYAIMLPSGVFLVAHYVRLLPISPYRDRKDLWAKIVISESALRDSDHGFDDDGEVLSPGVGEGHIATPSL